MMNNTTASNISMSNSEDLSDRRLLIQMVVLITLMFVGMVSNMIIVFTGTKSLCCISDFQRRQKYNASLITSLAVADMFILGYCIPLHIMQEYRLPMSLFVCRYLVPMRDVFALVSILTITAVSLERSVAIGQPFSMTTSHKHWIVLIWIVSYLVAGLPMVFVMNSIQNSCVAKWRSIREQNVHQACAFSLIIIPGIITTLSYIFTLRSLQKFRKRRQNSNVNSGILDWSFVKQTRSISSISITLVAVFWLCCLPLVIYAIAHSYKLIHPTIEQIQYIWAVLTCIFYVASALNPLILIALSPLYKKSAYVCLQYFFKTCCLLRQIISRANHRTKTPKSSFEEHLALGDGNDTSERNKNQFALVQKQGSLHC